jgi:hypothetical protein
LRAMPIPIAPRPIKPVDNGMRGKRLSERTIELD